MSLRLDQLPATTSVSPTDLLAVEQAGVLKSAPVSIVQSGSAGLALDSTVVHNTGNETIAGIKTFSLSPIVPATAFPLSALNFTGSILPETANLVLALGTTNRSTASGTLTTVSFSGTPNASQPPTLLRLTVTNGPISLSIPASFRLGYVGSTTLLTIPNGNHELSWQYDGQFWLVDSITQYPQTGDISAGLAALGLFTGIPTLADSKIAFTDITTGNASIAAHGFTPKLPNNASLFLNGIGTWTAPGTAGGGAFTPTGTGFFHVTSSAEDAASVPETGTGNVVRATSPTITGLTSTQLSNTSTQAVLYGTRFTDTSPVGHTILVMNAAANASLLDFDINGNMVTGTVPVGRITGILPVANGGSGTATPSLTGGTSNVTIGGTWPNQSVSVSGGGGGGASDIQIFTASGTWTKPSSGTTTTLLIVAGGCGGGSGRKGLAATIRGGGAGGGSGGFTRRIIPTSLLGATETVTVGAGGAGGASVTVDSTNGNPGAVGGNSTFGIWGVARAGSAGGGGTNAGAAAGFGGSGEIAGAIGGGASATGGAGSGGSNNVLYPGGGGGGGGGVSAADVTSNGADGGSSGQNIRSTVIFGGSGGAAGGTNGGAGSSAVTNEPQGGGGGAGGGSKITAGTAGSGGNGGNYGGGGGGGGAGLDATCNSGAGGNGAGGIVIAITN